MSGHGRNEGCVLLLSLLQGGLEVEAPSGG